MPELPEVESIRRTLVPLATAQTIRSVRIYNPSLRWMISDALPAQVAGQHVSSVERRAKYLVLRTAAGSLVIHLGMTGRLVKTALTEPVVKHDHVDIVFDGFLLRYNDPRRFGSMEWHPGALDTYPRFQHLGPEPLSGDFSAQSLQESLRKRTVPIKAALMDSKVVVGLGNIYVSEALHRAGIHPLHRACDVTLPALQGLVEHAQAVLKDAIVSGGSSLSDYVDGEGRRGSFQEMHQVYGRVALPCRSCDTDIESVVINARASFYCPQCQPLERERRSPSKRPGGKPSR